MFVRQKTVCVAEVMFALFFYVVHNVWPLGMENQHQLADCIDSEHLNLLFLKCGAGGPARFTRTDLFNAFSLVASLTTY